MKKVISILLTTILLFSSFTCFVLAEEITASDIIIQSHEVSPSSVQRDQSFIITLNLKNMAASKPENIKIIIYNNASFSSEIGNIISIPSSWSDSNTMNNVQIPMKYHGGSSTNLALYITYDLDGETRKTPNYYMNISTIADNPPPPQDTTKFAPVLGVVNTAMPSANAGSNFNLTLTVANMSTYYARDITIIPTFEGSGKNPFQMNTINTSSYLPKIEGSKTEQASFSYFIPFDTPSGIYSLSIKYRYSNIYGDKYETTEQIFIRINNHHSVPSIKVDRIEFLQPGLETGTTAPVKLYFKNAGTLAAKNIKVTLEGLINGGFTLLNVSNSFSINSLEGGRESFITIPLAVSERMVSGSHDLTAKIEYSDEAGNSYVVQEQFFIPVIKKNPQAFGLQLQNIVVPGKIFKINEYIPITFNLTNTGEINVYNTKITLSSDAVIIPRTPNIKAIHMMTPGQTDALEFIFSANSEAVTKNYPIAIHLEYEIDQGGERIKQNLVQYVGVFVENKEKKEDEESIRTVPKIIIDSYQPEPQIVRAGQNFKLNVSFLNTNSIKTIQNIKVFFTVNESTAESGTVFTPVNSSNTFFIDRIAPKNNVEMDLVFYTIPDAKPKTYTMTANFEYEDAEGNPYTATELIGIPVVQQSRLETATLNLPQTTFMNYPVPLFFEFYNMGKVTLYNLMIRIEGEFSSQNSSYFVGNFDPGYSDYYDTTLFPTMSGNLKGTIVFAYDDSAGEHQEIRKEFSMMVEEMIDDVFNPGDPGKYPPYYEPEPQQEGIIGLIKKPVVWGSGIFIIVLISSLIIMKKIKSRKELTLDE